MSESSMICSVCGEEYLAEQMTPFGDKHLCTVCLERDTLICDCCGERIWWDANAGDGEITLCRTCFREHYHSCVECGRVVHRDRARYLDWEEREPLCPDCCNKIQRAQPIHEYSYKPKPRFVGEGPLYMGVELEIDGGGENPMKARKLLAIANRDEELIYIKRDSSLESGLEIVTFPLTLQAHETVMPWGEVMKEALSLGYLGHKAGTAGLHVHVSLAALGDTPEEQDAVVARILYFHEKHWAELLRFSRRTNRQLMRWANRYGYKEQPREILNHAKGSHSSGRYTCVNLLNEHTVEFRMFRSSLRKMTFLAALQLVERICEVARNLSDEELKQMSWSTFVSGCTKPELVQYLKERRLYVNEPVAAEEEL